MTADRRSPGVSPTSKEELEAEIVALRSDLGATVEALTDRLDVKKRLQEKVVSLSPALPVAAAAVAVAIVAVIVWRRRS